MGGASSQGSTTKVYNQKNTTMVDCNPYVATSDFNTYIKDEGDKLSDEDRLMLQKARHVVSSEPDFVFRHCEVRIVGRNIDVVFYAGSASNIYVVNLTNVNKDVEEICKHKGMKRHLYDIASSIYKVITDNVEKIIGAIGGLASTNVEQIIGAIGGLALKALTPAPVDKLA